MFKLLDYLTIYKRSWADLSDSEQKIFDVFMVHRVLSMHPDLIDIVGHLNKYYNIPKENVYTIWLNLLPKEKLYIKYIKKEASKINLELVSILAKQLKISTREVKEYLGIIETKELQKLLWGLGYDAKQIKKLLK